MKQIKKIALSFFLFFAMLIITSTHSFAQFGNALESDDTPINPCTDPDEYCPIDGGVVALLAAGVGYGIKKVRDSRQKSVDPA